MIRKLALVGVIAAAALSGCATYDQYGYQNGRGDYYSGRPQVSSSVGVSIGTGYGYPYAGYGGYSGYGMYNGYGYGYGGNPGYYGSSPYYGRPYHGRPRPHRPRPDNVDRTPDRKPGWRDLDRIRDQNRQPAPTRSYTEQSAPAQRATPRPESRSNRGSFSGQIERARRSNRQSIEP